MTFNTLDKRLVAILFSTLLLSACGGGGGDSGDSSSNSTPDDETPIVVEDTTPNVVEDTDPSISDEVVTDLIVSDPIVADTNTEDADADDSDSDVKVDTDAAIPDNIASAALIANNKVSLARTNCGLKGLSIDTDLDKIAIKHANYMTYVFANSSPTAFDAHTEDKISDILDVTGSNNPFFGGKTLANRLANANYANANFSVTENIAQTVYFSSAGNLVAPDVAALSMTKSLLAAPYHLRSLMLPSSTLIGTGMTDYTPFNRDSSTNRGYVLVTQAATTSASKDDTTAGVFTYPCQGVSGTVTALYNESPDPFRGTRNLQTNPIGQPIYVNMPSADTIKVSNVEFLDVTRNIKVPVKLLDFSDDPYKNTNFELPANEAFIMPLTDDLKSCEVFRNQSQSQQCGLYGNSQYRVSFDVLVDNKTMESKSFTFTTGKISY